MNEYIIYHKVSDTTDCPDGILSAWVAYSKLKIENIIGITYDQEPPIFDFNDILWIVDFSFKPEVIQKWVDEEVLVNVIDHHKTAFENLSSLQLRDFDFTYDVNECGATLTWKTFFPDKPVPILLRYARDRDLWKKELPYTDEIHEALSYLRKDCADRSRSEKERLGILFSLFDRLSEMSENEFIGELLPIGTELLKNKQDRVEELSKTYVLNKLDGYTVPFVYLNDPSDYRLVSDLGNYLCQMFPEYPFAVVVTDSIYFSLRSIGDFDVSVVAKKMGGGGHQNSAGLSIYT